MTSINPTQLQTATVIEFPAAAQRRLAGKVTRPANPLSYTQISDALAQDRLVMLYQPQYNLETGQTLSAEALVRLIDENGELVTPDRFIALAETSDLNVQLGRAVVRRVCADLAASRRRGTPLPRVAINLAAQQLSDDPDLCRFIDLMLAQQGLDYTDLEFELTERQELTDAGRDTLRELAGRGSRVMIDDICTGHCSLATLAELPVSGFKLDRCMVQGMEESTGIHAVVSELLGLASRLNLDVIAEGVETPQQEQMLRQMGARVGQGFGYAKPMPMTDLEQLLSTWGVALANA